MNSKYCKQSMCSKNSQQGYYILAWGRKGSKTKSSALLIDESKFALSDHQVHEYLKTRNSPVLGTIYWLKIRTPGNQHQCPECFLQEQLSKGRTNEQRQVYKVRQDLSGSSKQPPKCRVQEETKEEQIPGMVDTRMDGADTTAPAKDMA
ncbi:MAG: hypothetical protein Q9175_002094 [Cornicularia normoerica]